MKSSQTTIFKLRRVERPKKVMKPMRIEMGFDIFAKVEALVNQFTGEVGWVGTTQILIESGRFAGVRVEEIFVPRQEVSHVSVDVRPENVIGELKGMEEKISSIRYQGHSHGMLNSVEPSITDLECWEEWATPLMEGAKITAFSIHNRRGDSRGFLYLYFKETGLVIVPAKIVIAPDSSALSWARMQREKIREEGELVITSFLKRRRQNELEQ
jgi:hypothetical protein